MKRNIEEVVASLLLAVLVTVPVGAETPVPKERPSESGGSLLLIEEGVPGGVVIETQEIRAEVVAIDYEKRTATLKGPQGNLVEIAPGPEAINFDQVKTGDLVRVSVTATLDIFLGDEIDEMLDGVDGVAVLAGKGERPGGYAAETSQMTATVTAVDLEKHVATLKFQDGSELKTEVRPDVELTEQSVGKKVVIRSTTEIAVDVIQP